MEGGVHHFLRLGAVSLRADVVVDLRDHCGVNVAHPVGDGVDLDAGVAAPAAERVAEVVRADRPGLAGEFCHLLSPEPAHVYGDADGLRALVELRDDAAVPASQGDAQLREEGDRAHGLGGLAMRVELVSTHVLVQGDRTGVKVDVAVDVDSAGFARAETGIEHEHHGEVMLDVCGCFDGGTFFWRDLAMGAVRAGADVGLRGTDGIRADVGVGDSGVEHA